VIDSLFIKYIFNINIDFIKKNLAININKSIKRLQQFQWIMETLKLYEGNSILNDWMEKIIDSCFFLS
jgi:hypothetical protein